MKRIIYIACICISCIFFACDDYLTVESPDQLTSGNFWRNQTDAEAGLAAAYSQMYLMTYRTDRWSFPEIKWPVEAYREDIISMGNDAMNYPNWVELGNYTYTNGNSQFNQYWDWYYQGISFANQVIEKTAEISDNNIDSNIRNQIVAEGHFLRAWYHMQLLLNWEQIILRDKYITNPEELSKPLTDRAETWDFIIEDLKIATQLPSKHDSDNTGRATCGTAYAYLGFAYLTRAYEESEQKQAFLTNAVEALQNVKGYELVKEFGTMFDGSRKNHPESIFEIQFSMSSDNGAIYRSQFHQWMGASEVGGWDEIIPTQILMDEFMKEGEIASTGRYDTRLYETIWFQCDYFNDGNGRVWGSEYDDWFKNPDGLSYNRPIFRKFLPPTSEDMWQSNTAINIPLMRYANVLLMLAEAFNELGQTAQAIPLINEVRNVHGDMPAMTGSSQEEVRAQIEHERMIEFPLENYRWYDLRRWGKLTTAMQAAGRNNFKESDHAFYPTPLTEINANDQIQ